MITTTARRTAAVGICVAMTATSCGFGGVNTLPLPGAVASGADSSTYHVEIANVGTLESNSPVMLGDVVVGSVGKLDVQGWHAELEVRVRPDVVVPANAVAKIGQTSLLGSMHLALDPPVGQSPTGRLEPGSTLTLNRSSTYPSTEQTLSALSVVVNAGGLGQIGDFIHTTASAFAGREGDVRQLLSRLDSLMAVVDGQRDHFSTSVTELGRLSATLASQKDDITAAMRSVPAALDVLIQERARLVTAMQKLGEFSRTTTQLVNATQQDLVHNLDNLGPTLQALADVGPYLGAILAYLPTYPFSQNMLDRGLRGDYFNIFATMDLTVPRLKRSLFLGTRWGDPNAALVPAPGDPAHLSFNYDPSTAAPNTAPAHELPDQAPFPPVNQPVLPVTPPSSPLEPPPAPSGQVFAGPYQAPAGGN